jgi:hypothetical protein
MLVFKESSDEDKKKFARFLYKQFFFDGEWHFSGNEVAKLDDWPKRLDTENFEICAAGDDFVCFEAGGDWQCMALCSIVKAWGKNSLKIAPFDYHGKMKSADIRVALERLRIIGSE